MYVCVCICVCICVCMYARARARSYVCVSNLASLYVLKVLHWIIFCPLERDCNNVIQLLFLHIHQKSALIRM